MVVMADGHEVVACPIVAAQIVAFGSRHHRCSELLSASEPKTREINELPVCFDSRVRLLRYHGVAEPMDGLGVAKNC